MGCIQTKTINEDDHTERQQRNGKALRRLVSSSRSDQISVADAEISLRSEGSRARLISKSQSQEKISTPPCSFLVETEKKLEPVVVDRTKRLHQTRSVAGAAASHTDVSSKVSGIGSFGESNLVISSVPNGIKAEYAAAGWPSWLTAVAGEAVRGWLPRRADTFEKMNKIGQGTYSSVYKARDLETGNFVALKKVRFVNMDPESVRFMAREIHILRRLDHPNVVKLEALITSRMSSSIYLVFEYMEHDLAGLAATPGIKFTEPQVKCYMQQLLAGLDHCHSRGVLHRDIKCSNLLIDNNGILKIADFGLATIYNPDNKQFLTSRVVTLWYRPPELLLGATDYCVGVDLWSTGCILAELLAGRPIMPGRTEVEQLHKIFKLCGSPSEEFWRTSKLPHATTFKPNRPYPRCVRDSFRDFPSSALNLLDRLLAIEPENRGTAASALMSEFFTTKPFACDPSSLPKYPPSKEYDAKVRNDEARKQREAAVGHGSESGRRKETLAPEGTTKIQEQQIQANPKLRSSYKSREALGFPVESIRGTTENGFAHHESFVQNGFAHHESFVHTGHPSAVRNGSEMKPKPSLVHDRGANLSFKSGPMVLRSNTTKLDHRQSAKQMHFPRQQSGSRYDHLNVDDASEKQDWNNHLLHDPPSSHKKDDKPRDKEPTAGYGTKKNRIHYSGPLMPPGGNIEEMLKEHERQIQQAVRRARVDKAKHKQYGEKGQSEALLYASR